MRFGIGNGSMDEPQALPEVRRGPGLAGVELHDGSGLLILHPSIPGIAPLNQVQSRRGSRHWIEM